MTQEEIQNIQQRKFVRMLAKENLLRFGKIKYKKISNALEIDVNKVKKWVFKDCKKVID